MSKSDDSNLDMYREGFKDGWESALKFYENKTSKHIGPAQTLDIQWPHKSPPEGWNSNCRVCHIPSRQLTNYVCYYPNCPSKVTS